MNDVFQLDHSPSTLTNHIMAWHTDQTLSLVIPAYNEEERLPIMLDVTFDYLNKNRTALTQLYNNAITYLASFC